MAKIDNEKMWASILNYEPTKEEKERLGKAFRTGKSFPFGLVNGIVIRGALREQGLMEKDGEIVDYDPQFKVGDWLVDKDGRYSGKPFVVTAEHENDVDFVTVQFQDGSEFQPNVFWLRKWEITDAKDGDILVAKHPKGCEQEESTFLFKGIADRDYVTKAVEYYASACGLEFNSNESGNGYMGSLDEPKNALSNYRPATNEEINAFLLRMDFAGYEWDNEKKELRKKFPNVKFPESDYEQLRQELDALRKTVAEQQSQIDSLTGKDMVDALKCHDAFDVYGMEKNCGFLMEECGELLSAVNKLRRGRVSKEAVFEELADVQLVITAFATHLGYRRFLEVKDAKLQELARTVGEIKAKGY